MVEASWEGRGPWAERRREERLARNRGTRAELPAPTVQWVGRALGLGPHPGAWLGSEEPRLAAGDQTGTLTTQETPGCGSLGVPSLPPVRQCRAGDLPTKPWRHWQNKQGRPWGFG